MDYRSPCRRTPSIVGFLLRLIDDMRALKRSLNALQCLIPPPSPRHKPSESYVFLPTKKENLWRNLWPSAQFPLPDNSRLPFADQTAGRRVRLKASQSGRVCRAFQDFRGCFPYEWWLRSVVPPFHSSKGFVRVLYPFFSIKMERVFCVGWFGWFGFVYIALRFN